MKIISVFPPNDGTDYRKLLAKAQAGDNAAFSRVASHLNQQPAMWQQIGDMAHRAQIAWTTAIARDDLVSTEGIERRIVTLRAEWSGAHPSPLEQLLVERLILCWLQVHDAETRYAGLLQQESHELSRGTYYQKRIDRCHFRLLAAVRTLAVVRKLLAPSILVGPVAQMNVSEQAVNVVGAQSIAD